MLSCACRDTTPVDSDDHQPLDTSRDTPPPPSALSSASSPSALQSHGFKASCDSLDGNVTPPAADVSYHDAGVVRSDQTNDIDSGVASGSPQQQPPLLKQVHAGKTRNKAHASSAARSSAAAPAVHDLPAHNASAAAAAAAPPAAAPELSEVQVPADGGDDSSDANSYYEDIDNIDDHGVGVAVGCERDVTSCGVAHCAPGAGDDTVLQRERLGPDVLRRATSRGHARHEEGVQQVGLDPGRRRRRSGDPARSASGRVVFLREARACRAADVTLLRV